MPSGITFSQLYVLLAFIHDELFDDLSMYFEYETTDRKIYLEEFDDGEPDFGNSYLDVYDTRGTYIDTFFKKGFKISQYTDRDFDLTIEVEKDAEEYPDLNVPKVIKVSRIIADEEGGQPGGGYPASVICLKVFFVFFYERLFLHDILSITVFWERNSHSNG